MYILYLLYITIELNTMIIYTHNVYIIFTIYNNRVKYYDNIAEVSFELLEFNHLKCMILGLNFCITL